MTSIWITTPKCLQSTKVFLMAEIFWKIGPTEMPVRERLLAHSFQDLSTNEVFINLKNRLKVNLGMTKKSTRVESLLLSDSCWITTVKSRVVKMIVLRKVKTSTKTTLFWFTMWQTRKF